MAGDSAEAERPRRSEWTTDGEADANCDGGGPTPRSRDGAMAAEDGRPESVDPAAAGARAGRARSVTVYGVEFDVQDERDRVVILGDKPLDYLVYEPDPETLVISISDAEIEPEAAVRIAPEAGGPVSLVTAFAQPESRPPRSGSW